MLSRWRRFLQANGEEISPLVGLSFAALYLVAVAAVGAIALHLQHQELSRQRLSDAGSTAHWIAEYLGRLSVENPAALSRETRRAARDAGIDFVAVVSPEGNVIAHSDPTQAGRPAEQLAWQPDGPGDLRVASSPNSPGASVLEARIDSPDGKTAPRQLRIGLAPVKATWTHSQFVLWSGYVLLAVLGLYLLVYRWLRRAVQPLAVIRGRLLSCRDPIDERLVGLRLNDSYDQISASWNRLIEFVSETQDQLRRSKLTEDVTGAMDGYRSERLSDILMQIPFGVLVVDAEQTICFANRAATGMLAAAGGSLEGTAVSEVLDESARLSMQAGPGSARGGTAPASRWTDHVIERPHGQIALRIWSIAAQSGGDHILFLQDVTQLKEAERARDQFLYHVTHELRTPLTNIRAYAETLSQGVIEDVQTIRECYNVIMGETHRLNRLVEDILNVSQLEVGTARINLSEVQIDELLRKTVQDTQGSADAKNLDLVLHLPAKLPRVRGDRDRLSVVLTNLVGNAIKYTPEEGSVEVRCVEEQGRVRITVTDTGIGIKPEDQEGIFEKFYRVDDDRVAKIPGTGLGLSIVRETVRLHGGAVFVESASEKGSTFSVVLPAMSLDESATQPSVLNGSSKEKS